MLKEKSKVHTSRERSKNASRVEQFEIKGSDRERSGKAKVEPSASKSSVNTMERKVKDKTAKRESNNLSDLKSASPSCVSPTKSDDSEQGSVSDVTATNGNSPNSNTNDAPNRKQESALNFQIGARLEAKDLGSEIWWVMRWGSSVCNFNLNTWKYFGNVFFMMFGLNICFVSPAVWTNRISVLLIAVDL